MNPTHSATESAAKAEELYRCAMAYRRGEALSVARAHLEQAVALDPSHARAHGELGSLLLAEGNVRLAARHAQLAVEISPDDEDLLVSLAALFEADRQTEKALEIVQRLLRLGNESSQLAVLYAQMASNIRRESDALQLVRRVLESPASKTPRQLASLHFSAAGLLDSLGHYDQAFEEASLANSLRGTHYDPGSVERPINEWIGYFDRPTLRRLPRATHGSEVPVFIVGMARSGTTLLEQILSSHPDVYGAGELNWIFGLCESLAGRYPTRTGKLSRSIDAMSARDVDELAEEYLQPLAALNPSAARIINKMHTNFIHLGLIQLLFPGAKVIHCRRDRQDTCLSCYMTDFTAGNDFSFSLASLGHYHRNYERLMSHWKSVLDLPILEVRYEDVVNDLEGQARRALQFLDLPWNDNCLRFHENRRFVATASNEQVRRPIYRSSVGRWRHYEKYLAPLRDALG